MSQEIPPENPPVSFARSEELLVDSVTLSRSEGLLSTWERTPIWARRATLPAIMFSIIAHACLVVLGTLIYVEGGGGAGGDDGRAVGGGPVEMALMSGAEFGELQAQASDSGESALLPAIPDIPMTDPTQATSASASDTQGELADSGGNEASSIGSLAGGGELGSGEGDGMGWGEGGGGGGGGANFFGVAAAGTRFAFLVDISGSMDGKRMTMLKEQLNKSVVGLAQNCSFFVVAFSDGALVIGEKHEWREATDINKRWATSQLDMLSSSGGTNPLPGAELIFRIRPRPDAVYLMTDGEFSDGVLESLANLNRQAKLPIHTICLGNPAGQDVMKQIAKNSGGTFKFIPQ